MFGYTPMETLLIAVVVVLLLAIPTAIFWYVWRLVVKAEKDEKSPKASAN